MVCSEMCGKRRGSPAERCTSFPASRDVERWIYPGFGTPVFHEIRMMTISRIDMWQGSRRCETFETNKKTARLLSHVSISTKRPGAEREGVLSALSPLTFSRWFMVAHHDSFHEDDPRLAKIYDGLGCAVIGYIDPVPYRTENYSSVFCVQHTHI